EMRLDDGTVWPIPITLAPPPEQVARISVGDKIALRDADERLRAILTVTEKYPRDNALEIPTVYGTEDDAHPGVAAIRKQPQTLLAGPVDVVDPNPEPEFPEYRLTPAQTRAIFAERGWQTI